MIARDAAINPVIVAHVESVLSRLREHPDLEDIVFVGEARSTTADPLNNYVSVYWNAGMRVAERLDRLPIRVNMTFTFHWVSIDPLRVSDLAQAGMQQLLGWVPDIPNRNSWPLDHSASRPIDADKAVVPWLWFGVDQFDLSTTPSN